MLIFILVIFLLRSRSNELKQNPLTDRWSLMKTIDGFTAYVRKIQRQRGLDRAHLNVCIGSCRTSRFWTSQNIQNHVLWLHVFREFDIANGSPCNWCALALGLELHIFASLHSTDESQEGRTKQLSTVAILFVGSCHVWFSKRPLRSISLAVYWLENQSPRPSCSPNTPRGLLLL